WTRPGRNLYLIGGNAQTAWFAGVATQRYLLGVFVLSGVLSALGGAFTAISQNTAMPNLGEKSLMLIVAAVIVGGTAMSGGRGSVGMSVLALIILNALTNGLSYLGASKSVKLIAHGAVLAAVIILDAWRTARQNRTRGQRRELLEEWERPATDRSPAPTASDSANASQAGEPAIQQTGMSALQEQAASADLRQTSLEADPDSLTIEADRTIMQTSDRTFATVCVASVACVAIVAIFALAIRRDHPPQPFYLPPTQAPTSMTAGAPATVNPQQLKASDGQPLIWLDTAPLNPPVRPADPTKLANDDLLRWYDYEYAGWTIDKLPMPPSPRTGPRGKKVVSLQYMDHPYWTGYRNGMERLAQAYGMELLIMEAGNDNKVQADQVEQVIRMKPDLVILTPVDANGVVPMLKRLHDEGLPVIASNLIPVDEGMKYVLTWTGPDDWGQFRMLAREFARLMNHEGGYCVVRHIAGTSCYLSRTWAAVSELKQIAPKMECLDMQATDLKTEETKTQVAAWLKKFGPRLKGIVSADDSKAQVGIVEALKDAGRTDVICASAGSSRTGLTYLKEGKLHALTYQSAEADGALPIEIAAHWFNGQKIERPVYYIQKHIITTHDVSRFWPPQW
ncbi:MAG: substrate-binding domain-containing protein, partial [Verrucomicrobia bacterium]|nr:substrate-binding domain-containing protein [Verrucomicrobiota bacterium]